MWCHLRSGLMLKTSVFPAAGADRLNDVVHHDREGGRQLWHLLQRSAVHHQGLVGEFLPVALHSPYSTTNIALTAATHCSRVHVHMHWTRVHRPEVCLLRVSKHNMQVCDSSVSGDLCFICMSATVDSVGLAYNAIFGGIHMFVQTRQQHVSPVMSLHLSRKLRVDHLLNSGQPGGVERLATQAGLPQGWQAVCPSR